MDDKAKEWIIYITGAIAVLMLFYGILQVLISFAEMLPVLLMTGIFFLILQIVTLVGAVLAIGAIAILVIQAVLSILSKFESDFNEQIASLRRSINKVTNNLASEVLAIISSILMAIAQDNLSSNSITKYSIGILSAVYLFFSIQLIKSDKKKDKVVGVFFYIFPILVSLAYYLADIKTLISTFNFDNIQVTILPAAASITLLLAFYYSFKPQSAEKG